MTFTVIMNVVGEVTVVTAIYLHSTDSPHNKCRLCLSLSKPMIVLGACE